MTTAQKFLADNPNQANYLWSQMSKMRDDVQDLAVSIGGLNCHDRIYCFHDGSELLYTATGFQLN